MYFSDEKAAGWDTPERTRRAAALVEEIRREIGDARGKTALEIGSGTGLLTFGLCPYFMEICTADTAAAMQKALGEKLAGAGIKNVRPIEVKDLEGEAYRGKFDLIYSSMVFHHIRDIAGELALVAPLLKRGGRSSSSIWTPRTGASTGRTRALTATTALTAPGWPLSWSGPDSGK